MSAEHIPRDLLAAVYREARRAFPEECCGWLAGPRDDPAIVDRLRPCANAQNQEEHPTAAERSAETAYLIASQDLFALNRSLDSDVPARIIYHSHPNGRAHFSPTDREVATNAWGDGPAYPVQYLVVGIDHLRVSSAALFAWSDEEAAFVEIARYDGAEV